MIDDDIFQLKKNLKFFFEILIFNLPELLTSGNIWERPSLNFLRFRNNNKIGFDLFSNSCQIMV